MYLRLVVPIKHEESHRLTGIFRASGRLLKTYPLTDAERERLDALIDWFDDYLPLPPSFRAGPRRGRARPIFWFKSDAGRYINRVRELAALLERLGLPTRLLRTPRPGYVVYEDVFQVAAVPFRDTRA